ncbi:hypothetical protein L9F63_010440, partial [Diploptera punctata]
FITLTTSLVLVMAATVVVWTTDLLKIAIDKNIGIRNNTLAYDVWVKPPIYPLIGIYVFNYTNTEEYLAGIDEKLKVKEVGPFVYRETTEKVNVVFNDNGTVTYQQKSTFDFVPELSGGHLPRQTRITVPNLPLLSAMSVMKDMYILTQLAFLAVAKTLETRQFVHLTAHDFFWGYDDPLFSLARTYASFTHELPYKRFGLFAQRNGVRKDRITIYTGVDNKDKFGIVSRWNGADRMHYWNGEECNRIDGTDGSFFPPHLVNRESRLYIYHHDMCRRLPLEYKEEVISTGGIPALRYQLPRDIFANPDVNPENACFCHPDIQTCPPSGVFNASPCSYGAPLMMSLAHFYLGDPVLLETVEGLKPDPERHESYTDMHPEIGVPLDGKSRMQVNMMIRKSNTLSQLASLRDGSILPIAWFDVGLDDFPDEVMTIIYHVTFTRHRVQIAMQYGFLSLSAILLFFFVRRLRNRSTSSVSPI